GRHQRGTGQRGDVERARVLAVNLVAGPAQPGEVGELLCRHPPSVARRQALRRAAPGCRGVAPGRYSPGDDEVQPRAWRAEVRGVRAAHVVTPDPVAGTDRPGQGERRRVVALAVQLVAAGAG